MEQIFEYSSEIILIMAAICTLVVVITQLTKGLGVLDRIPTKAQVIILSVVITIVTYLGMSSHFQWSVTWYGVASMVFVGMMLAFVCLNGWEALFDIFRRFGGKDFYQAIDEEIGEGEEEKQEQEEEKQ